MLFTNGLTADQAATGGPAAAARPGQISKTTFQHWRTFQRNLSKWPLLFFYDQKKLRLTGTSFFSFLFFSENRLIIQSEISILPGQYRSNTIYHYTGS